MDLYAWWWQPPKEREARVTTLDIYLCHWQCAKHPYVTACWRHGVSPSVTLAEARTLALACYCDLLPSVSNQQLSPDASVGGMSNRCIPCQDIKGKDAGLQPSLLVPWCLTSDRDANHSHHKRLLSRGGHALRPGPRRLIQYN